MMTNGYYTSGNNDDYPGCGACSCCQGNIIGVKFLLGDFINM